MSDPVSSPDIVSYFRHPITNIHPLRSLSLYSVYKMISGPVLSDITHMVHNDISLKGSVLPYITPSGCFEKRNNDSMISYSGIVHVDFDKLNTGPHAFSNLSTLVHMLSSDKIFPPALIFISPSGFGIKVFIRVRGYRLSFHKAYFKILTRYYKERYELPVDQAGSDISRPCYLCRDQYAYFSDTAFAVHTDILEKYPPEPDPLDTVPVIVPVLKSLNAYFDYNANYRRFLADKLNKLPDVHDYAVRCLVIAGWNFKNIYFSKPGKVKSGTSATFRPGPNGHVFYCFSDAAPPFSPGVGYSDIGVIALIVFKGDYKACVDTLSKMFLR